MKAKLCTSLELGGLRDKNLPFSIKRKEAKK
jgi:hypothetical protein